MAADYQILLNVKTCAGYENFGKFYIGNNLDALLTLNQSLHGNENDSVDRPLQVELKGKT